MKKILLILLISFISLNAQSILMKQDNADIELQDNFKVFPESASRKSTGRAILYSLLLPGMGELYAGDYSIGQYLTVADGVFWGLVAGFNVYGDWEKDNYISFAASYGGVDTDGKDDDYFATIGDYSSSEQYNTIQELNRDFRNRYTGEANAWKWRSEEDRRAYRNSWVSSEKAYNNVRFAVGALVLNRLVSAINATRLVIKHNKSLKSSNPINVGFGVGREPDDSPKLMMMYRTSF